MSYIILFIYCVIMACAYGLVFKKPFAQSIAPAFFLHILLCIVTGVIFGSVSLGIWGGIVLAVVAVGREIGRIAVRNCPDTDIDMENIKNSSKVNIPELCKPVCDFFNDVSFPVFVLLFAFIIIINSNKCFRSWDEFSHWGMFLKETLRLDKLYCVSPKDIAHKDYVPLVTMFEAIWCRLSFRYREADVYRAVQMLQFSMIFPLFLNGGSSEPLFTAQNGRQRPNLTALAACFLKIFIVIITLLYIYPHDGLNSFHTIYQDIILAFFLFYAIYAAFVSQGSYRYDTFHLTLSLTMLILVKMTAIFFVPFIVAMYFVRCLIDNKSCKMPVHLLHSVICGLCPLAAWKFLNVYIKRYVTSSGTQTYDNVQIGSIFDVITHNGAISYQNAIDENLKTILSSQFFGSLSIKKIFVVILALMLVLTVFYADRIKLLLLDIWLFIVGIAYAFIIYFLYCTQFSEVEAIAIAGFPRYYISFIYAAGLLLIYIFCNIKYGGFVPVLLGLCFILGLNLGLRYPYRLMQLLPGQYTGDIEAYEARMDDAAPILNNTADSINERIFCIICSRDYGEFNTLRYDVNPRTLDGGIIGLGRETEKDEGWSWAWDMTIPQLAEEVSKYDYIYFKSVDDLFLKDYSGAFYEPERIAEKTLFRVNVENAIIKFE